MLLCESTTLGFDLPGGPFRRCSTCALAVVEIVAVRKVGSNRAIDNPYFRVIVARRADSRRSTV
jgi:hypothetical protein